LLSLEPRRAILETERAVTGAAGSDRPQRTADRNECRRLALAAFARRERSEIGGHIGDFLIVEGCGHPLHDRVLSLAAVIRLELLVRHRGGQSGKVRKGVAGTDAPRAMAGGAAAGEGFSALCIAGCDGAQRLPVPSDRRGYGANGVHNLPGSRRSSNAGRATDRIPPAEAECVRLQCRKPYEAD